jgi:predicted kinase
MSCYNPNSIEFKNKLKSQPNPILASIELDMEANISNEKKLTFDVLLPIGTSGSGKSTFIKSLPQKNLVVIEPDAMRVEFTGDMNNKSKDKEIYEEAAKRAIVAIKQGKQVVFDTTNLTKDKRLPFIEAIKKEIPTANIQYKLMELNPELAKQRIKAQIERGENRANVSDSTIERHADSYKQMLVDIKNEPITEYKESIKQEELLSLEEYYLAYRNLYELGSYKDYIDYRQKSKDKFVIGSKDDVSLFEQYLEQKDWDSNSNFNIKCL